MTWDPKRGDIGRFRSENWRHPRFVVVRVLRNVVQIWYSGASKSQTIPRNTFVTDCVDTWNIDIIEVPEWFKPDVKFRVDDWVTLARLTEDPRRPRTTTRTERLDLTGHELQVFSVRRDHAACLVPSLRTLVLIPLKVVNQRGFRVKTRWDRILEEDDFDDYEDYLSPEDDA